jgi:hypothetical protein
MNPLQPVSKSHFKKTYQICQKYIEGVSQPIVQITWLYKGNPILQKVYDRNTGKTEFFAVSKSIEAKRKASMKPEIIVLQVDGVTITGTLKRTAHDIAVEITSPYRNLKSGLHIPYFASSKFSFTGEYGIERANELIHGLYELGSSIEAQMPVLRRMYAEAISETGITYNPIFTLLPVNFDQYQQVLEIVSGEKPLR